MHPESDITPAPGPNTPERFAIYIGLAVIAVMAGVYAFGYPIIGQADQDLWYHLNGGRYFFAGNKVPDNGFFSFLAESRSWTNYYWLSQVIFFRIFDLAEYHGLVIFRTILYLTTALLTTIYLLSGAKRSDRLIYLAIVALIISWAILPRYFHTIRPHIFSYFAIVITVIILERGGKPIFLLPFLAIAWSNLHGVEYPVLYSICFSYLAGILYRGLRNRKPLRRRDIETISILFITCAAVLVNPFGHALLLSPFESAPLQHLYVRELLKPEIGRLLSIDFSTAAGTTRSMSNIALMIIILCCVKGLARKSIRTEHLLLVIIGLYLLSRADRFRYEAILLALPLMKNSIQGLTGSGGEKRILGRCITALIIAISTSYFVYQQFFLPHRAYPLSTTGMPTGIARFLNKVDSGGRVLNMPGDGGYLQWALADRYKIAMDLEMMLFTDSDIYQIYQAFHDPEVLNRFIDRFQPTYLAPPADNFAFPAIINRFPQYEPVYFDEHNVLYVDSGQQPLIAKSYGLRNLTSYSLQGMDIGSLTTKQSVLLLAKLTPLYAINPHGELINRLLALLHMRLEEYDTAMKYCRALIKGYPELADGYLIGANIMNAQSRWREAVAYFLAALERLDPDRRPEVYWKTGINYLALKEYDKAYPMLRKGVNIFSPDTDYTRLNILTRTAALAGNEKEARRLKVYTILKAPE